MLTGRTLTGLVLPSLTVERFIMNEERSRLDYIATATDPLMFSAPVELTYSWAWIPGEVGMDNECVEWDD